MDQTAIDWLFASSVTLVKVSAGLHDANRGTHGAELLRDRPQERQRFLEHLRPVLRHLDHVPGIVKPIAGINEVSQPSLRLVRQSDGMTRYAVSTDGNGPSSPSL
jgi:hypothetical protein